MEQQEQKLEWKRALPYLAVLAPVMVIHLFALGIHFQLLDYPHLAENPAVFRTENVPAFFSDPGMYTTLPGQGMYRPILMSLHAVTYEAFAGSPAGYHLVSILLHLFNAALVLSILRRWTGNTTAAVLGALFWGLAAVQHQAVGQAVATGWPLSSLFMLATVRVTEEDGSPWLLGAVAGGLYLLALLSMESAFILPLLLVLRDLTVGRARGLALRRRWPVHLFTFALAPAYLLFRSWLFPSVLGLALVSRHLYLLSEARVMFWYLMKIAFPINLSPLPAATFFSQATAVPIAWVLAAGAFGLMGLVLAVKRPLAGLGMLWFLICLAPTSTLVTLGLLARVDRLYLALLGPAALLSLLLSRTEKGNSPVRAATVLAAVVILLNAAVTIERHLAWGDEVGLMRETVERSPMYSVSWAWLGRQEREANMFVPARRHLEAAVETNPADMMAQVELAKVFIALGEKRAARQQLEPIVSSPDLTDVMRRDALIELARIDIDDGLVPRGREKLELVMKTAPLNRDALILSGLAAERTGDLKKAREYYQRALWTYPDSLEAEYLLGALAMLESDNAAALKLLGSVVEKDPPWPEAYANLAIVYIREGDLKKARKWALKAIEVGPHHPSGYMSLGLYYGGQGDLINAKKYFEQAIQRGPGMVEARNLLARACMILAGDPKVDPDQAAAYLQEAGEQIKWLRERKLAPELEDEWRKMTGTGQ